MAAHKKHRKRGSGSLRVLPSGRWRAQIMTDDGYVAAPQTFDTKMDAQAWLAAAARQVARGAFVAPTKAPTRAVPLLVEYTDRWLAERPLKPRTRAEYDGLLQRHILPQLGGELVTALSTPTIRSWYAGCAPDHPATRVKAYSLLKTVLGQAEEDGLIPRNPCRLRGAGTPPAAARQPIPTVAQVSELDAAMPPQLQGAVLLAAWGGLRLGEVLGLRGEDLALPVVHVRQSMSAQRGGATVGTPKSRAGVRQVVLPPSVAVRVEPLAAWSGLLFPSAGDPGKPMATSVFYKGWYAARKTVGVPDLRFHTLRHFAGTQAARAGGTVSDLMARMGHTSPAMAAHYQRAGQDADLAARMDPS